LRAPVITLGAAGLRSASKRATNLFLTAGSDWARKKSETDE